MHWIALQARPEVDAASCGDGALVDATAAIGWWALQFTEKVAQAGQAVVLEVSGSDRLFGGREHLIAQILATSLGLGPLRMAQAPTSLVALAQLQINPADFHGPDGLPLATLPEAREHLATLERLGCTVWSDLRALPRGGVARRFGAALLDALDRAYGLKPEVYPWMVLPDVFDVQLELFAQVEAAPSLLFAARRLLSQLQVWLQARQHGILAFELVWQMDARRNTATHGQLVVRTAQPTRDMQHMQRLLAENLAQASLPAPVLYLRLRSVETDVLPGTSGSLLPDALNAGDNLHQLLERLSARLGAQQVLHAQPYADHRPEHMQVWVQAASNDKAAKPATALKKRKAKLAAPAWQTEVDGALYPTWLLPRPLKLAVHNDRPLYQGPLALLAGPQRLEVAWWDVAGMEPELLRSGKPLATLRDYFLARSEQAGLLWVYRERLTGSQHETELAKAQAQGRSRPEARDPATSHWFLHGLFG